MKQTQQQASTQQDFELPVKRVEGDTLKERMTANAYDRILPARYLLRDEERNIIETPEELFRRVAEDIAEADREYMDYETAVQQYEELMTNLKFMPNSPTLMNAGDELQQLSACFVVHPEDDMHSIFDTAKNAALIHKSGGGTGYPFHLLRPKGDKVGSTGGIASGPMSFMDVFDTVCGTVKQGGKRRGAQMGIMRVDHPDVLRFVVSKRTEDNLTNFNISVGLTDDFMEAVKNDEDYTLINPRTGEPFRVAEQTQQFYNTDEEYYPTAEGSDQGKDDNFWRDYADSFEELSDYDIELEEGEPMTLPAKFIWECLVDSAWTKGEPGLFMYDRANQMHSFDTEQHPEHRIEATNPCGEQPLENNEACNLGHINLSLLAEEKENGMALHWNDWKQDHQELVANNREQAVQEFLHESLDMEEFERIAKIGTRFLDNVVTRSNFPLDDIEETVTSLRKIGLGIMGFAQLMIQLGIEYGSEESQYAAKEIQRLVTRFSIEQSHKLADERGEFPEWEKSKWANPTEYPDWFEKYSGGMDPQQHEDGLKLRNHNTTTIAPTGTTSMIGDTSGGCEPIFSLAYFKNVGKDIQGEDMLVEFDDYFIRTLEANDIDVEEVKEEAEQLMRNNEWEGVDSLPDDVLPPHVKTFFKTADSVTAKEHVDIQAAFQEYNHSGISKTCNFPHEATREDVAEAFMRAYEKGCKGLTVYRDGTRDVQVMTTREQNKIEEKDADELADDIEDQYGSVSDFLDEAGITVQSVADSTPRQRPQIISGTTQKIDTGYGGMYVTINEDEQGIFEIFTQMGKSGGFTHSLTEAISRLTSLALRSDVDPREVQDQLEGIRSPRVAWDNSEQVLSIPDGIAKALERYMNGEANQVQSSMTSFSTEADDSDASDAEKLVESGKNPECPECGGMLSYGEGCVKCEACGYSKCG
ncbi:MAG: adenosylcobalamin-dependent ribonucleoside-diphosphate reductase [Candidatus Nanohaloarchaeota archaeon QJJ-5]|nr:adenosylcobalamin-dependent ribonucleoside-diphosphate reductase [Candidatus Nanohaloarchaeota archaeon QJJ-5]